MAHLGEKLKNFRLGKNWKQPQMAEFIGIATRTYHDIEKTGIVKKAEVLKQIFAKTKITSLEIAKNEMQEIADSINQLNKKEKENDVEKELLRKRITDLEKIILLLEEGYENRKNA